MFGAMQSRINFQMMEQNKPLLEQSATKFVLWPSLRALPPTSGALRPTLSRPIKRDDVLINC